MKLKRAHLRNLLCRKIDIHSPCLNAMVELFGRRLLCNGIPFNSFIYYLLCVRKTMRYSLR